MLCNHHLCMIDGTSHRYIMRSTLACMRVLMVSNGCVMMAAIEPDTHEARAMANIGCCWMLSTSTRMNSSCNAGVTPK